MELVVSSNGQLRCVYTESLNLRALGKLQICRGSHVEPDEAADWWANLSPVNGPWLGPFADRSAALQAELNWLSVHWLAPTAAD